MYCFTNEISIRIYRKGMETMGNLVAFLNSFLSYLLLFGVFVVIVIIAVAIGITLRKSKDTKEAAMEEILETVEPEEATADTTNE